MFGDAAENLDGQRAVVGVGGDQLQRLTLLLDELRGMDQIRGRQPQTTQFPQRTPEGQMRIAGERRQKVPGGQQTTADADRTAGGIGNGGVDFGGHRQGFGG